MGSERRAVGKLEEPAVPLLLVVVLVLVLRVKDRGWHCGFNLRDVGSVCIAPFAVVGVAKPFIESTVRIEVFCFA